MDKRYLKSLSQSRKTTLFVLHWRKNKFITKIIDDLMRLRSSSARLLIVYPFFTSDDILNKFLHDLWKFRFLDISILTYNQQHQVMLQRNPELLHLSRFNPFTGEFSSQVVS